MKAKLLTTLLFTALFSVTAQADCSFKYQICEKSCDVKHLGDDAAVAGCTSKCVAKRGACLAEVGAEKTVEAGKDAWEGTKSFIKGLTDD
ncbi:hypothetical protein [Motiliproteus sp.]|uniref:hypothetical protein n=1 Tax=Motiliproteus sp. TaxID=1898955 RepID=UPI003BAA14D0